MFVTKTVPLKLIQSALKKYAESPELPTLHGILLIRYMLPEREIKKAGANDYRIRFS